MNQDMRRTVGGTLLLHPFQLPVVVALAVAAVVFTIWPEALNHAPIAFERRGVIHHLWHYTLFAGSFVTLYGMCARSAGRFQAELGGLLALVAVVAMNTIAVTADLIANPPGGVSGLGLALRYAVIWGLCMRIYILVRQPTVHVSLEPRKGEG